MFKNIDWIMWAFYVVYLAVVICGVWSI